jgi:hypothetical protein
MLNPIIQGITEVFKRLGKFMVKWFIHLVDRLFAVSGALLFSQAPLFIQQYQHQLYGHISELKTHIAAMQKSAAFSGKTLNQYILKFIKSGDVDFASQGELMQNSIQRYEALNTGYQALIDAPIYYKPFLFFKYYDWQIGSSTYETFKWGLSFNMETLSYALLGIVFGLSVFWFLYKIIKSIKFLFASKLNANKS